MEVNSEEDKRFKAILLRIRYSMRCRSRCDWTTNSRNPELEARLRQNARPDSLCKPHMMGKVNRERLAEYLGELQRKEDTNDRYVAALRGETLTRNPHLRIQPIPKLDNTKADEQKLDNKQKK
ncbi:hypothetical protein NC651_020069 [Populus alba x Populus x berolinensis]|nr:hypothetical protein NC651_020069 [Populus alba x Populus x berolinensis]